MDCDLNALLEKHKRLIFEERTRLGLLKEHEKQVFTPRLRTLLCT